jgi:hypothetical protein
MGIYGMKGPQVNAPRQTGKRNPSCAKAAIAALAIGLTAAADRAVFGQCEYFVGEIVPPSCPFGGAPTVPATTPNHPGEVV